jgi:hypothetical protein
MKKFIIFLLPILLVGCINITSKNKNYGNIISTALSGFMTVDKVTSIKSIKTISVDLSAIPNIQDSDKAIILKQLKKKRNAEIKFASLDSLETTGVYDKENKYLDGVLFTIKEINKVNDNNYNVNTTIYHSGDTSTEAICNIEYLNGTWQIIKTEVPTSQDTNAKI